MKRILLTITLASVMLAGCGRAKYASQARLDQLSKGMTLSEAETVMGGPGKEQTTFKMPPAAPGDPPWPDMHYYSWTDPDGSYMLVCIEDGKLSTADIHTPEKPAQ